MKRYTLIIAFAFMATLTWAELPAQAIGLQIGYTQPIYRLNAPFDYNDSREHLDKTILNGFKIGMIYDATIIKGFGFAMGLNYSFGATSQDWKDYPYDAVGHKVAIPQYQVRSKEVTHTLEIFVDWQYKFEIAKSTWLMLYTGPTIQCNLKFNAKEYYRNRIDQEDVTSPIIGVYGYADSEMAEYYRRLNITWGFGAGFQYKRYFLRGGYDFGLINPYNKRQFGDMGYTRPDEFGGRIPDDRYTRGRLDQWQIKLGIYLWEN